MYVCTYYVRYIQDSYIGMLNKNSLAVKKCKANIVNGHKQPKTLISIKAKKILLLSSRLWDRSQSKHFYLGISLYKYIDVN